MMNKAPVEVGTRGEIGYFFKFDINEIIFIP